MKALEALDESFKKSSIGINEIPELVSLLYDLDLMPEQIISDQAKSRLLLIVEHFKAFNVRLKSLTTPQWQECYEVERDKFQQETRRTSELAVMLRKILIRLHDLGCRAEVWNNKCPTCDLMIEVEELLNRPINAPPPSAPTGETP